MTIRIATLDPSLSATHITKQLMGDTTLLLLAHTQELTKLQCWLDTLTERNKHLRWLIKDNIFSFRSSWIAAWWDHQASRGNKTHFLFSSTLSLCHWFYTLVVDWCSQSILLLSTSRWQRNTEKKIKKISALEENCNGYTTWSLYYWICSEVNILPLLSIFGFKTGQEMLLTAQTDLKFVAVPITESLYRQKADRNLARLRNSPQWVQEFANLENTGGNGNSLSLLTNETLIMS